MNATDLIRVMQFSDSVLPVGAFAFSNGVEAAIQKGVINDVQSLQAFVLTSLKQVASCDGIAIVAAHRAVLADNRDSLLQADWAVHNRKLNEENRLMVTRMGKKLAELTVHVIDHPLIIWWLEQIKSGKAAGTYPVTQALAIAIQGIGERALVVMQLYGVAVTMLSAAIRLMRVTHFDTQHILYSLNEDIEHFCSLAEIGDISQMASYAPVIDVLASIHVDAHVRLFMN
ncbi:urease accessory protein UreF (plasmid) [Hafnia alvei]|uniref:urease accessory protein UreF n=1 Tax=Hafnia alvei TaxID=569 RepID=UPI000B6689BE|nr:urease accessory protein UreF [Hafnia alvei]MBI0278617.1 urease accessory protein UreF [Hafnia alvei]PNL03966.1 urease accessory protein UreF [Hafnia alvei]